MKRVRAVIVVALCGVVTVGSVLGAGKTVAPSSQEIAAKPELVTAAIRNQNAEVSAAIVVQTLTAVLASDWTETKKRHQVIALVTYAVASKGTDAGPMMGLVAAGIPSSWLPVVAATAIMAAGDASPAVAAAMLDAMAGNTEAAAACRAACANPSAVLSPTEIGIVRGTILPTPTAAPAKAPPLPTIIRPAEQYPGQ